MTSRSILIGVLALAACTTADANTAKRDANAPVDTAEAMLARMDRNGDQKVSFEEFRNAMVRRFAARDRDGSGALEGKEFPPEWLVGADLAQSEGKVTIAGFSGELRPTFDRFDTDKDGYISGTEIDTYAAARRAQEGSTP